MWLATRLFVYRGVHRHIWIRIKKIERWQRWKMGNEADQINVNVRDFGRSCRSSISDLSLGDRYSSCLGHRPLQVLLLYNLLCSRWMNVNWPSLAVILKRSVWGQYLMQVCWAQQFLWTYTNYSLAPFQLEFRLFGKPPRGAAYRLNENACMFSLCV